MNKELKHANRDDSAKPDAEAAQGLSDVGEINDRVWNRAPRTCGGGVQSVRLRDWRKTKVECQEGSVHRDLKPPRSGLQNDST